MVLPLLNSQRPEEHDMQELFTNWAVIDDVFALNFRIAFLPPPTPPVSTTDQKQIRLSYPAACAKTEVQTSA